jgi:hypothetical protein
MSGRTPPPCPAWCRGCGPDDPLHRSDLATIGREGTGWMSVQLIVDRFIGRGPVLRVDTTRYGSTQTALLSEAHANRLIKVLTQGRDAMADCGLPPVADLLQAACDWPYRPAEQIAPGTRIRVLGGVADLLGVEQDPAFPDARLLRVRPAGRADAVTVLVPADYRPSAVGP